MKTPKIQSLLNLPLWQMPKQLLVRLSGSISLTQGKFKSLLSWNSEPKSQAKTSKPKSQKKPKKTSEPNTKPKRGRPRKDATKKVTKKS